MPVHDRPVLPAQAELANALARVLRLHAIRAADPPLAARFVDMAVDPQDRPERFDRPPDAGRADWPPEDVAVFRQWVDAGKPA